MSYCIPTADHRIIQVLKKYLYCNNYLYIGKKRLMRSNVSYNSAKYTYLFDMNF